MLNSNEQFEMDDSLNLSFVHVRAAPIGGGKRQLLLPGHLSSTRLRLNKRSVIPIPQTDDNLCCARAIVTAKAHADNHIQWRAFQRERKIQLSSATNLHLEAGVAFGMCGPPELRKFAEALPGYKIVVVDASRNYHCYVYGECEILLGLLFVTEHYDALKSLPGFFGHSNFCGRCYQAYDHQGQHACTQNPYHCGACLQDVCADYLDAYDHYRSATVSCQSCGRQFYGEHCLTNHQPPRPRLEHPAILNTGTSATHVGGAAPATSCCGADEEEKENEDRDSKETLHVFFDIECMQEDGRHVPNLVVAETESNVVPPQVFEGDTCIKQFLTYLDTLAEDFPLTVLAHNFQGYDSYPIIEEYHRQRRKIEQVRNGGKVLQLTLGKIRFIDSLSFFQMPLSAFPKTFGLSELKKGHFLIFSTPELTRIMWAHSHPRTLIFPIAWQSKGDKSLTVGMRTKWLVVWSWIYARS